MREEVVEDAAQETSSLSFDDEVVESVEDQRRNHRADAAFPVGITETRAAGDRCIRVTFELPHGDETFYDEFDVDPDSSRSVDDLLEAAGLDPELDDIGMVDGRPVPVERRMNSWQVDLSTENSTTESDDGGLALEVTTAAGALISMGSLVMLFVLLPGMALGEITGPDAIFAGVVLLFTRLFGEALFALSSAQGDHVVGGEYVRRWDDYLSNREPSTASFAFHLLTGAHFLD